MSQGSLIYLQQIKETGFISKSLSPQGRLSHCLYTLFDQLHVDFYFAIGYTQQIEFLLNLIVFTAASAKQSATF